MYYDIAGGRADLTKYVNHLPSRRFYYALF
jgi:hypothetical protein